MKEENLFLRVEGHLTEQQMHPLFNSSHSKFLSPTSLTIIASSIPSSSFQKKMLLRFSAKSLKSAHPLPFHFVAQQLSSHASHGECGSAEWSLCFIWKRLSHYFQDKSRLVEKKDYLSSSEKAGQNGNWYLPFFLIFFFHFLFQRVIRFFFFTKWREDI